MGNDLQKIESHFSWKLVAGNNQSNHLNIYQGIINLDIRATQNRCRQMKLHCCFSSTSTAANGLFSVKTTFMVKYMDIEGLQISAFKYVNQNFVITNPDILEIILISQSLQPSFFSFLSSFLSNLVNLFYFSFHLIFPQKTSFLSMENFSFLSLYFEVKMFHRIMKWMSLVE